VFFYRLEGKQMCNLTAGVRAKGRVAKAGPDGRVESSNTEEDIMKSFTPVGDQECQLWSGSRDGTGTVMEMARH
jgi:hypothetical protein